MFIRYTTTSTTVRGGTLGCKTPEAYDDPAWQQNAWNVHYSVWSNQSWTRQSGICPSEELTVLALETQFCIAKRIQKAHFALQLQYLSKTHFVRDFLKYCACHIKCDLCFSDFSNLSFWFLYFSGLSFSFLIFLVLIFPVQFFLTCISFSFLLMVVLKLRKSEVSQLNFIAIAWNGLARSRLSELLRNKDRRRQGVFPQCPYRVPYLTFEGHPGIHAEWRSTQHLRPTGPRWARAPWRSAAASCNPLWG